MYIYIRYIFIYKPDVYTCVYIYTLRHIYMSKKLSQ